MDLHEIVVKLSGDIKPVGETNEDSLRLKNFKTRIELVQDLIEDLTSVANYCQGSLEASVREAESTAHRGLSGVLHTLKDYFNE